jgi:hypothetical protein
MVKRGKLYGSPMRRRQFIKIIGGAAAAWPLAAPAQQSSNKIPVVGVLWHAGSAEEEDVYLSVLVKAFHDLGYDRGRNIHFDHRFPAENPERFQTLARELVDAKPDVNRSPQPASHAIVLIGLDSDLLLSTSQPDFGPTGAPPVEPGPGKNWLVRRHLSPPFEPIFQEADPNLRALAITFAVRSEHLRSTYFRLATIIQTPGYSATENWAMVCQRATLTLYDPTHPKTRTA